MFRNSFSVMRDFLTSTAVSNIKKTLKIYPERKHSRKSRVPGIRSFLNVFFPFLSYFLCEDNEKRLDLGKVL